jgi:hypothetical protein
MIVFPFRFTQNFLQENQYTDNIGIIFSVYQYWKFLIPTKPIGGLTSYFLCGGGIPIDVFWNEPLASILNIIICKIYLISTPPWVLNF